MRHDWIVTGVSRNSNSDNASKRRGERHIHEVPLIQCAMQCLPEFLNRNQLQVQIRFYFFLQLSQLLLVVVHSVFHFKFEDMVFLV